MNLSSSRKMTMQETNVLPLIPTPPRLHLTTALGTAGVHQSQKTPQLFADSGSRSHPLPFASGRYVCNGLHTAYSALQIQVLLAHEVRVGVQPRNHRDSHLANLSPFQSITCRRGSRKRSVDDLTMSAKVEQAQENPASRTMPAVSADRRPYGYAKPSTRWPSISSNRALLSTISLRCEVAGNIESAG